MDAERSWHHLLTGGARTDLKQVWGYMSREVPTMVIQGFPGTGKSTLMARLALYMARRRLGDTDPLPVSLDPPLIPVFCQLREYADAIQQSPDLSLVQFIAATIEKWEVPALDTFIGNALRAGDCLVLLDGLDEISSIGIRRVVQEEISRLIKNYAGRADSPSYDRILITSRVAGYDQQAFPAAAHVTIAELDLPHIDAFLTRWCYAIERWAPEIRLDNPQQAAVLIERKASMQASRLRDAIDSQPNLLDLAENPLLLALLVVMQHNDMPVPLRRVELYRVMVKTMLEDRNLVVDLPTIDEDRAVALLGPLAIHMQSAGNSLARRSRVTEMVAAAIGESDPAPSDVDTFLDLVRERGGVFARRTDQYYGFSHRVFQEYFCARHLLAGMGARPGERIAELIELACRGDDLWREVFIMVVAYASDDPDSGVTGQILDRLLAAAETAERADRHHHLLVAAECLVDVRPTTVARSMEAKISTALLEVYHEAHSNNMTRTCAMAENVAQRLLLRTPREGYRSAFHDVLYGAIVTDTPRLQSAMALLAMIAGEISYHSETVLVHLVPALLGRLRLDVVGEHVPAMNLSPAPPDVADLAVTVLSMLGARGPAGSLLPRIREYFSFHPESLTTVARLSLEARSLLTPTVAPVRKEASKPYLEAVDDWRTLLRDTDPHRTSTRDVSVAVAIHDRLLDAAQQARYPVGVSLLEMFDQLRSARADEWRERSISYLRHQLAVGEYQRYRSAALLWTALFPDDSAQGMLARLLRTQFGGTDPSRRMFAQRYITMLCDDKRVPQYERYLDDLLATFRLDRDFGRSPEDLRDLYRLRDLQGLRNLNYSRYWRFMAYLGYLRTLRGLHYMRGARTLRRLVSTPDTSRTALRRLKSYLADDESRPTHECVDLLVILRDRVDVLAASGHDGGHDGDAQEVDEIARSAADALLANDSNEVAEIVLKVLEGAMTRDTTQQQLLARLAQQVRDRPVSNELQRLLAST